MEISTEGIYEIRRDGKKIVLIYCTEENSTMAMSKLWKKQMKWMDKVFPKGIFESTDKTRVKSKLFPSKNVKGMLTDGQGGYYPNDSKSAETTGKLKGARLIL